MVRRLLTRLKQGTEYLNYGREIISSWAINYANDKKNLRILDIGLGIGTDLLNIKLCLNRKDVQLLGVESHEPNIEKAKKNGINAYKINIENECLPFPDEFCDIVIANQIIEHSKEIFWIFSEISRVLKKEGIAIIGVPNLASFHNRLALLFGQQPTSLELLGPHVRGITKPAFTRFITCEDYFHVIDIKGSNFYPFPPSISKTLTKLCPTMGVGLFFLIQRTGKDGKFIDILKERIFETPYFTGNSVKTI